LFRRPASGRRKWTKESILGRRAVMLETRKPLQLLEKSTRACMGMGIALGRGGYFQEDVTRRIGGDAFAGL